ncbi:Phage terminase small subunit [Pseudomonas chlororaphis subsp. aureofaciens]|uniref:terminase small subunit n=1 Tax=Pseudomonas chlororaphis TaxID=587753 RepID=UPI000F56899E|nr:terminase small subunit [Pseudomonas chlororaphis]AZD84996.1 Phage terminase small subunit [Pseudomonas chlororaphis subsp. aureofaciens]
MALTAKQRQFVVEYLIDLNATQAAIRAGYAAKGAKDQAYQLMQNPKVLEAIHAAMAERNKRVQVDADYVLQRLTDIDQMDLAAIHDDDGKLLPIRQWPQIWRQMVKEVDMKSGKVKFHDKLRALELIGKHVSVNAFREQIGIGDPAGGPIQHVARNLSDDELMAIANGNYPARGCTDPAGA